MDHHRRSGPPAGFVQRSLDLLRAAFAARKKTNALSDIEEEALRALAEALKTEEEANAETSSAPAESADSDAASKKAS
jgi:hypothetical protein